MGRVIPRDWANWLYGIFGDATFPVVVASVLAYAGALWLVAVTLSDMSAVPAAVWHAANRSARSWRWSAKAGVLVVPIGVVVSWLWWFRVGSQLHATESSEWRAPSLQSASRRTQRRVGYFFATFGALAFIMAGFQSLDPDPQTIYISDIGHQVEPRPYIASHCPESVLTVGHLADPPLAQTRR
jgi:hypothetical protein